MVKLPGILAAGHCGFLWEAALLADVRWGGRERQVKGEGLKVKGKDQNQRLAPAEARRRGGAEGKAGAPFSAGTVGAGAQVYGLRGRRVRL